MSASATDQAPLASTRMAPAGPSASRTAATRATSAASTSAKTPRSATLTLAVRQPDAATSRCAVAGSTTGTVVLTGTRSRRGAGQPIPAASSADASHGTHWASV